MRPALAYDSPREVPVPPRPAPGSRLAALDLGTNNCRLLIAAPHGDSFRVVDSFSRIVRLGEGLAATHRLSEAAMDRTIAALRVCRQLLDRHRVAYARFVATEACRQAVNAYSFMRRVLRQAGIHLELLGQEEEARLAMLGCLPLIDPDADRLLMVDIGGGSTEIMWLDRRTDPEPPLGQVVSVPIGVVTLSESLGQPEDAAAYASMVDHVHRRLVSAGATALPTYTSTDRVQMLGTSGTVTTLAALNLNLRRYDRRQVDGTHLSFAEIDRVATALRAMSNAERAANPCIGSGRADLVIAGCAILDAVRRIWPVEGLRVADRGLREGILGELMGQRLSQALLPNAPPAAAAE
jgi:exopolyphosphatase/guanosine-5'-triphosphate,3'-diphosphate pyrophosphatase